MTYRRSLSATGASAFPECLEVAEKYDRNLFVTPEDTSDFMADVISSLHTHLAPRTTMHGVLVEVHGEGVLLTGDSGIGKSETALELIKRGHKLIADDAVDIRRIGTRQARRHARRSLSGITWSCAA